MPNTRLEHAIQEVAQQQPVALLDATASHEDLNTQFGITNGEKYHFRGLELALPIGSAALTAEGKVILDRYTNVPKTAVHVFPRENEAIRHTDNQSGEHEWLFDPSASKGQKRDFTGIVAHQKIRTPDLTDDGSSWQSSDNKPQQRRPLPTAQDVAGDSKYNQVTGRLLGFEDLYSKPEFDAPSSPIQQPAREAVAREQASGDSLSHIHVIGEHTLATLRRAHKLIHRK